MKTINEKNNYLLQRLADLIACLNTEQLIEQFNIIAPLHVVNVCPVEIQVPIIIAESYNEDYPFLNMYIALVDGTPQIELEYYDVTDDEYKNMYSIPKYDIYHGLLKAIPKQEVI